MTDVVELSSDVKYDKTFNQPVIVKSIIGRQEDNIVCKNGLKVGRLNFLFKKTTQIKIAQIVQHQKGSLEINIVPDGEFDKRNETKILEELIKRTGHNNLDVNINIVENKDIVYTSRNKFRQIISSIN